MNEIVLRRLERTLSRFPLLAIVLLIPAWAPAPAAGEEPVFADGFECCDAASWSATTGGSSCFVGLSCSTQSAGEVCVAGRIFDFATSAPVTTSPSSDAPCTAIAQGGPCALTLRVYDGLSFVGDPTGTPPLTTAESVVDACGRFRLSGFEAPVLGFAAVAAEDAAGAADDHVHSTLIVPVAGGDEIDDQSLYTIEHATDEAWTVAAGSPFDAHTFSSRGAIGLVFLYGGTPVAGVTAQANGSVASGTDFYFSDAEPARRTAVDPDLESTGVDGSALIADNAPVSRDGTGGLPPGCVWESALVGSAEGLVVVQELRAVVDGDESQECP